MALNDSTTITLVNITCTDKGELTGDDLYLKYRTDGGDIWHRYPSGRNVTGFKNIKKGERWNLDLNITFKETLHVALYDKDPAGDDYLGEHQYRADDNLSASAVFDQRGGKYVLKTEKERALVE